MSMIKKFRAHSPRLLALIACAALMLLVPRAIRAQDTRDSRIAWMPERPVQGTLFRVRVSAGDDATLSGRIGDEPLHFSKATSGWEAIAAAPLDGGSDLRVTIVIGGSTSADTLRAKVPIGRGNYALEKLTVAPRFGAPADSATQARMDRERERALAVSRASHATPRLWTEVVKPRDTRMTSPFGSGREFNGQVQSRHTGMDLAGTVGSPVRAAARGVVALVDTFYLAGRVIYIDHGEGLVTAYFHLSRHDVAVGDTVEAGQQIGLVGATGRVTGPHLHWVVRYGAISVDPLSFLAIGKP
jgi:murein DD-endopeptidase MepM/ murein hydrolase activator NlpD